MTDEHWALTRPYVNSQFFLCGIHGQTPSLRSGHTFDTTHAMQMHQQRDQLLWNCPVCDFLSHPMQCCLAVPQPYAPSGKDRIGLISCGVWHCCSQSQRRQQSAQASKMADRTELSHSEMALETNQLESKPGLVNWYSCPVIWGGQKGCQVN